MKKKITILIAVVLTAYLSSTYSQVALPYYTGFDNAAEKNGWVEYRKATTTYNHWGYASPNAYSAPDCLFHDFSPSSGVTLSDDWFVSPSFIMNTGGKLDSIRYSFTGFSVPGDADTVAIYILNGSQDPSLAESKILLFDFRGSEYINDNNCRIKTDLIIPSYIGQSYFAFRYRNSNFSSNWLTTNFDNISLSINNVSVFENNINYNEIEIYPNPADDYLFFSGINIENSNYSIINMLGQNIKSGKILCNTSNIYIADLKDGIYFVNINIKDNFKTFKFVKR